MRMKLIVADSILALILCVLLCICLVLENRTVEKREEHSDSIGIPTPDVPTTSPPTELPTAPPTEPPTVPPTEETIDPDQGEII